jgi:hypothetical protein
MSLKLIIILIIISLNPMVARTQSDREIITVILLTDMRECMRTENTGQSTKKREFLV